MTRQYQIYENGVLIHGCIYGHSKTFIIKSFLNMEGILYKSVKEIGNNIVVTLEDDSKKYFTTSIVY